MKKYELSLSRNYVSSWGVEEAIRELLQNAKDSDGEEKILIDSEEGLITIINKNTSIPSSTLLLGNTSKKDDLDKIGQFGEGYKLALLVLLREGKEVLIHNGDKLWIPNFEYSETFECEVLCINETNDSGKDLIFEISGFDNHELHELQNQFLGINGKTYNAIETSYGQILTDPQFKGKIFVDGLPVYEDDNFDYGYNFKPCYVSLDRDRKSINIYELKRLTALSVACCVDNFAFVDEVIDGKGRDGEYIKDENIEFDDEFKEKYAKHLMNRFDIKEDDVVINENSSDLIEYVGRKTDKEIKEVPKKIYADILNSQLTYSSNVIQEVKKEKDNRDKVDDAWYEYEYSDYKDFKEWFDKYGNQLNDSAKDEFKELINRLEPTGFNLICNEVWK
ncbi:MAG: hypothetical protein MR388_03485 [Tenericutes bacterium]|nr:hypothetical protein [Mycoplasmatota bacterium]